MTPSVLIAGLGSIGRRHLNNLLALGCSDVSLYRTGRGTLNQQDLPDCPVFHSLDDALETAPSAVVIANPTSLHVPTALAAVRAGAHVFMEKPVSHSLEGLDELQQIASARGLTVLVGFQFRFNPGLQQVRRWLESGVVGPVVSAHAHWGEYLPGWHPWEDYRGSYSARADLGGGVVLTLCHPFDYLRWLIGEVESVSAMTGATALDLETEDTCQAALRFSGGAVGSVYLDYVQRPSAHDLRIVCRDGTILWDNHDSTARLYRAADEQWTVCEAPEGFERNDMFLSETQHFLDCLSGTSQPCCSLEDGVTALKIALAVKAAAREGREVRV